MWEAEARHKQGDCPVVWWQVQTEDRSEPGPCPRFSLPLELMAAGSNAASPDKLSVLQVSSSPSTAPGLWKH